jgi:hypothetical protein
MTFAESLESCRRLLRLEFEYPTFEYPTFEFPAFEFPAFDFSGRAAGRLPPAQFKKPIR